MRLQKLSLTNFRAFKQADFDFKSGMNLIVGINGVGKSSALDAIRILFSQALPKFSRWKNKKIKIDDENVSFGYDRLVTSISFTVGDLPFIYTMDQPRDEDIGLKPNIKQINEEIKQKPNQPLVVYYSATRSSLSLRKPDQGFDDALIPRQMNLQRFGNWWLAQKALAAEMGNRLNQQKIEQFEQVIYRFMEGCVNFRVEKKTYQHKDKDDKATERIEMQMLVDKGDSELNVLQLSDGERGMLALILDLANRLMDANPDMEDSIKNGEAIVLIDELDLHFHPRWQRDIVRKLTDTFSGCQFIATTHSPQIVGEVEPEKIILLEEGRQLRSPNQSLGMDSNWILDVLMETQDRNKIISEKLDVIGKMIEVRNFLDAKDNINNLRLEIGDFPELAKLETRIHRIQTLGK